MNTLKVFGCFGIVYTIYHLARFIIPQYNKNLKRPFSTFDKIFLSICCIGISAGVSFIFYMRTNSNGDEVADPTRSITVFFVILIPAIIGVITAFEKDAKQTANEREDEMNKIISNRNTHSEW